MRLRRLLLLVPLLFVAATPSAEPDGLGIMESSRDRHERYPYVFERVDLITVDRKGRKNVRKARRYWRVEDAGDLRFLWVFEQPPEVRGVAFLASIVPDHAVQSGLYLPAFGARLKHAGNDGQVRRSSMAAMNVLGTDFSIQDLSPEDIDAHRYERLDDLELNEVPYYQVRAVPRDVTRSLHSGFASRVHLIRKDTLMIERTDYMSARGRLVKRLTRHELKPFHGESYRAGMSLMEDYRTGHSTLIKVRERVDSEDYVPKALFQAQSIYDGQHLLSPEEWALAAKARREGALR